MAMIGTSHFVEESKQYNNHRLSSYIYGDDSVGRSFFSFFFICSAELIGFGCVCLIGKKCEFSVFFRVCCFQTCKMKQKKKNVLVKYWNLLKFVKIFHLNILMKFYEEVVSLEIYSGKGLKKTKKTTDYISGWNMIPTIWNSVVILCKER